jgi:hypothetical protein
MKWCLNWGESIEADAGYQGEPLFVSVPKDFGAKQRARARHKPINRRLKRFQCPQQCFPHDPIKHVDVFWPLLVSLS